MPPKSLSITVSVPVECPTLDLQLPSDLDRIVSCAIAKDPLQRYQSVLEMAADIQQLRQGSGLVQKAAALTGSRPAERPIPKASAQDAIEAVRPWRVIWTRALIGLFVSAAAAFVFCGMRSFRFHSR
jgi:hypothetical protein